MGFSVDIKKANSLYSKGEIKKAFVLYKKYADMGDVACSRIVAWIFFDGVVIDKDYKKAEEYFNVGACEGDKESTFGIVKILIEKNELGKASQRLKDLGRLGYAPANYWCGWFCEKGLGGEVKSIKNALLYYQIGAKCGHLYSAQREKYLLLKGELGFWGRVVGVWKYLQLLYLGVDIVLKKDIHDFRLLK